MNDMHQPTGAESPQGDPAPFGITAAIGWIATGIFVGLVALVAAAGTWSSPLWAIGVGAALAVLVAGVSIAIEHRAPAPVMIGVLCAVIGSLITAAWFAPAMRDATVGLAGQWMPESALKAAYADESNAVATSACLAMLDRGGALSLRLHDRLSSRPRVASQCITSSNSDVAPNVRRRLGNLWLDTLTNKPGIKDCQLVEAYRRIAPEAEAGQRLLSIRLGAASPEIRQCADDLFATVLAGSKVEVIKSLGTPDALPPRARASLFSALSRTLYAPGSENQKMKDNELLRGWNVQLGCQALEAEQLEVVDKLNSVGRSEGCGHISKSQAAGTWWRVCYDLKGVGLRDALDTSCQLVTEIARDQAFGLAQSTVAAAVEARQKGMLSEDIDAGRDLSERLSQYEDRFAAERMKEMLKNSDMPPHMRNKVMADLSSAQRTVRSNDIEMIKGMGHIEDVDKMNRENMARSLRLMKSQGMDLEDELKAKGVDSEILESEEFQQLLGEAEEAAGEEEGGQE